MEPTMKQRIPITAPVLLELMAAGDMRWPDLDSYICRPLPKGHAELLSKEAKAARQRARVRISHRRAKLKRTLSALDAPTPTQGGILRDVLDVRSPVLIDA
jgi:hypothetical protein